MKADHDAARHVATKTLRARPIKIGPRAAWAQGCGLFPIPPRCRARSFAARMAEEGLLSNAA